VAAAHGRPDDWVQTVSLTLNEPSSVDLLDDASNTAGSLLDSLTIVARHRGVFLSREQLLREHQLTSPDVTVDQALRIARTAGLRAHAVRLRWQDLFQMGTAIPAIVLLRNGAAMVLTAARTQAAGPPFISLRDPAGGEDAQLILDEARFTAAWTGEAILLKRDYRLRDEDRPFGLGWVIGQLLRDRRVTRDLAICAVLLGMLAISPVLFWRVMIDRVLYYGSLSTFTMLCIAFLVLLLFETIFGHLRRYLVLFVTTRVDVKIWAFMFNKMLNLPIDFFERTPTGEIIHKLHEIQRIRQFLTSQLFGTLLDSFVLVMFLPVMFMVSTIMTAVVLSICLLICIILVVLLPTVRRKVGVAVQAEVQRGTQLVEAVHGIRAIKSLALDARQRHEFDVRVARVAETRFDEGLTANLIQTLVHPLHTLMTNGVIAVAVYLALTNKDTMYIGAIFAFMIMTQRVTMPVIQAAQSIVQVDEARRALHNAADIVNQQPEPGRSGRGIRTPLTGRIEFSELTFSYPGTNSPALDRVSFSIPEGSVFGLVGRSGSGKTTVTRLLQGLHSDYKGLIKIDGNDLREIDVDHLRSSIGVVLQENFLFRGTIRETITAAKPHATFEEVVHAARLAGAEEFVERLPAGYETFIQEGSTNLSGGQRQRLAIARALITNPRILMLDEATSALDADSEAIVNANLMRIAQGRTLIIISHRLSALVAADQIVVLERGVVYDSGTHEQLLERCDIYAGLWHLQHRHLQTRPTPHEIIPLRSNAAQ
jgi:ATP-binding cassette, subfamily B, bacterial HlyB/CyaB